MIIKKRRGIKKRKQTKKQMKMLEVEMLQKGVDRRQTKQEKGRSDEKVQKKQTKVKGG